MPAPRPSLPERLQELRDVHLPDPVSWWPPAPGWWILLGVMVLGVMLVLWVRANRQRTKARRLAITELKSVTQEYYPHHNDHWLVQQLSEIMRRYAMAIFPRSDVAGLTGHAWLQFLDRTGQTNQFTEGPGHLLSTAPYRPPCIMSAAELVPLVEQWIQRVPPSRGGKAG